MKKFQHIHILMLTALLLGFLVSAYIALNSFKNMVAMAKEDNGVAITVPVLTVTKKPYTVVDYQRILEVVDTSNVTVDIKPTHLSITSSNIENEAVVRQTVMAILSLDRHLYIDSFCGAVNNICNNNAIEIILKGEKNTTTITDKSI